MTTRIKITKTINGKETFIDLKKQIKKEWKDNPDDFIVHITLGELRKLIKNGTPRNGL